MQHSAAQPLTRPCAPPTFPVSPHAAHAQLSGCFRPPILFSRLAVTPGGGPNCFHASNAVRQKDTAPCSPCGPCTVQCAARGPRLALWASTWGWKRPCGRHNTRCARAAIYWLFRLASGWPIVGGHQFIVSQNMAEREMMMLAQGWPARTWREVGGVGRKEMERKSRWWNGGS